MFSVRLTKRPPHGLGFLVRKRKNNPPVVISDLIPGGVAEQSGLIQIGDMLSAVNGVQLRDVPYNTALEVLRSVPMDSACVIVLRGPEGYRTRLESVLAPDGSVRVVRITDADPEADKRSLNGENKRKPKVVGGSPTATQGWPRNLPNDNPIRYGSPVRRARSVSRSPSRGSYSGSPIRTFPQYRDQSPCCCGRPGGVGGGGVGGGPEYQSVMAWNGAYPREVYQYRLANDEYFYESPRPSVDYESENERFRNGMIDERNEPQLETKGTQWPERVFLVRSRSNLSGVSTPGTENGFEVIPKTCPFDSELPTPTNDQRLNGLNVPSSSMDSRGTDMTVEDVTESDFKEITAQMQGLVTGVTSLSLDQPPLAQTIVNGQGTSASDTAFLKEVVAEANGVTPFVAEQRDSKDTAELTPKANDIPIVMETPPVETRNAEIQTEKEVAPPCPGSQLVVAAPKEPKPKFIRLKNLIDGKQITDTLHTKTFLVSILSKVRCQCHCAIQKFLHNSHTVKTS